MYDCGSKSRNEVQKAVQRLKGGIYNGIIDNLFISHYDFDHVSGLPFLLHEFPIRNIFLPMISPVQRAAAWFNVRYYQDAFYDAFLRNPSNTIMELSERGQHEKPNIINVDFAENEEANGIRRIREETLNPNLNLPSYTRLTNSANPWEYVLYNRRFLTTEQLDAFAAYLNITDKSTFDDIIKALQIFSQSDKKPNLSKALKGVVPNIGNLNDYSMLLWSGCLTIANPITGCLYTGDFNAAKYFSQFYISFYRQVKPQTSVVQMPHHGSHDNFNQHLCVPHAVHVISTGPNHPKTRKKTINTLLQQNYTIQLTEHGDVHLH